MNTTTQQPTAFLELVIRNVRLVQGHPLVQNQRTKDDEPVFKADGVTPSMETYFAVAVAKGAEAQQGPEGWKHTSWGQQVVARAHQDWVNGEHAAPSFAWKIEDGDSQVPNQNGKKNCDREGYSGHWIIKGTTGQGVKTWNGTNPVGSMPEILDKNALKCGDYGDVAYQVRGNAPAKSKGIYINPTNFVFTRAGEEIMSSVGSDAATLFGRETAALSPSAHRPAPVATAPVAPHGDFLNAGAPAPQMPPVPVAPPVVAAEPSYDVSGTVYTKSQLVAAGYTDAHFATMQAI